MKIIDKLDNILTDKEYRLIIKPTTINIINYIEIKDFTNTKIIIKHPKGQTTIEGKNLVISKMQDNEILITGTITNLEL